MEYITGIVFLMCYIAFFYFLGGAITKQEKSYPYQFLVGYLVYSFFVAIGGMPIMQFNLPFGFFVIYLILVYLILIIFTIIAYIKNKQPLIRNGKEFILSQWFLYILPIILVVISLSYVAWLWLNNCTDDGYYISQLTTFPIDFRTHPSTGYKMASGFNSYLINAYYAELAVYCKFLKIAPTLLCRVFFNYFHYFLFAICIYILVDNITKWLKVEISINALQWFALILLLFSFGHKFVSTYHIFNTQDTWQFNTAMYYGSSTIRCFGMFLMVLPFIHKEEITFKDVLYVGGISVGMMSQSSIALPVIIIVSYGYLIVHFLFDKKDIKFIILGILLLIAFVGIGFILPNNQGTQGHMIQVLKSNLTSIILMPCLLVYILSFLTRNRNILKINTLFLFLFVAIAIDPVNNILEMTSIYSFVAWRFLTMFVYSFIILNFIYFTLFVYCKILKNKHIYKLLGSMTCILLAASLFVAHVSNEGFVHAMKIIMNNPKIQPNIVIELGKTLEKRYQETGKYNTVVIDEGAVIDAYEFSLAIMLRSESPHTISLSATGRYGEDKVGEYSGFSYDDELLFYAFEGTPNDTTYEEFMDSISNVDVNCIILHNQAAAPYLELSGYTFYDVVEDSQNSYYLYVKD